MVVVYSCNYNIHTHFGKPANLIKHTSTASTIALLVLYSLELELIGILALAQQALQAAFLFQYIGMLDVPRPTSRVEIVAAMRRIRVSSVNTSLFRSNLSVVFFVSVRIQSQGDQEEEGDNRGVRRWR